MVGIRGFNMPNSCEECYFRKRYECSVMPSEMSTILVVPDEGRASWCPLKEIKTVTKTCIYSREDIERYGEQLLLDLAKKDVIRSLCEFLDKENCISIKEAYTYDIDDDGMVSWGDHKSFVAILQFVLPNRGGNE